MAKTIRINCTATDFVPYTSLKIIQQDLKDLHTEDYTKYKKSILKHGIMKPLNVWVNPEGEYCILDGTQATRTFAALEVEGYTIPDIPITKVKAKSFTDAKDKILSLASTFGTVNPRGFMEFSMDLPYKGLDELADATKILGLDYDMLKEEYSKDHTDKSEAQNPIDHEGLDKLKTTIRECPHCKESFLESEARIVG